MLDLLVIAYHFPPIQGSSGYLRTAKFVKYLPESGVRPRVLTVHPRAYPGVQPVREGDLPPGLPVHRSFALDSRKHLGVGGWYPGFLDWPDRIATWIPFGLAHGLRVARRHRVKALFSTNPIASAHAIALGLHRRLGLPWIADFRDPLWDEEMGLPRVKKRLLMALERRIVAETARIVVTTDGIRSLLLDRYPDTDPEKIQVLQNGFDEGDFSEFALPPSALPSGGPLRLIHAGLLNREDRDPRPFLRALNAWKRETGAADAALSVELIAPGDEGYILEEVEKLGAQAWVKVEKPVPYRECLRRMASAHALLAFQGPTCDRQIPAKLYEYFRLGRPVLALATPQGETGRLVVETGAGWLADMEDEAGIRALWERVFPALREGAGIPALDAAGVARFSRQTQARRLGDIVKMAAGP